MSATVIGDDDQHRAGAIARSCDTCDSGIWVAREHAHLLDDQDTRVLCLRCAAAEVAAAGVLPTLTITPEVARAVAKRRRRYARRLGISVDEVGVFPPVPLQTAAQMQQRRN